MIVLSGFAELSLQFFGVDAEFRVRLFVVYSWLRFLEFTAESMPSLFGFLPSSASRVAEPFCVVYFRLLHS